MVALQPLEPFGQLKSRQGIRKFWCVRFGFTCRSAGTGLCRRLKRYALIPPGGGRFDLAEKAPELLPDCWKNKKTGTTDVMGRLRWEEAAVTIRTEFFKPEKGRYLHPEADRPLTHLEASLLQSFPDSYLWCGTKLSIARQIGNAVPPALARAIAEQLGDPRQVEPPNVNVAAVAGSVVKSAP